MAEFKIGLSAAEKAQMKSEITNDVINAVSNRYTPTVGDGEYIGVRFYEGDTSGILVGNAVALTPSSFDDTNGYTQGTIESVFPFNAITKVTKEVNYKATGVRAYDANESALSEIFAKVPKLYLRVWSGYDSERGENFIEYDVKDSADESHGFYCHSAFHDNASDTDKDYALMSRYNLSAITTSTGGTIYIGQSGKLPADEVLPETIDAARPLGSEGLIAEPSLFMLLHYICFADRVYGFSGTENVSNFTGFSKDQYPESVPVADNSNKTFSVLNTSDYANLAVGMKVSFTSNQYNQGRYAQVTITSKTVGATYTVFGYADEVTGLQGKYLHAVFKVDTGLCDSITDMNGINMDYPAGHRPFVEFYIENPYGAKLWVDYVCYYRGDFKKFNIGDNNQLIGNRQTWESMGIPTCSSGWAGTMISNSEQRSILGERENHGFLTTGVINGSSTTSCAAYNQFSGDNEYCFFYGASTEFGWNNKYANVSTVGSTSASSWTYLAYNANFRGCYGRFYRNSRREN